MKTIHFLSLATLCLAGCIGTDYVDDPLIAARLTISPRPDSIEVGETVQFSTTYFNELGQAENPSITWLSTDPAIVSVDETGKATGLAAGPVKIIASAADAADTLILNTTGVSNSTDLRSGTFQDAGNHYHVSGDVRLEKLGDGSLRLIFEDNFSASAGPSLYVLLANHTNGSYMVAPGDNAVNGTSAQITQMRLTDFAGEKTFEVPSGIAIGDYEYVLLYCTLGPVFGFAELQ